MTGSACMLVLQTSPGLVFALPGRWTGGKREVRQGGLGSGGPKLNTVKSVDIVSVVL